MQGAGSVTCAAVRAHFLEAWRRVEGWRMKIFPQNSENWNQILGTSEGELLLLIKTFAKKV